MLGLSASTKIDHIIKGRNDITPEFAKEICDVVPEVNYSWLLKGEGQPLNEILEKRKSNDDSDLINLANAILEHEDELMEIPKVRKMIERHALLMLNDKLPELIDRIYTTKSKS